jgi:molybdenum cofactor biosynthesis protein B
MTRHTHGVDAHRHHHADVTGSVICAVITASDTRTAETDESGRTIAALLADAGHTVMSSAICPDDPAVISEAIEVAVNDGAQAILISGGTGIAPRDRTFDAVSTLIESPIPGFGELFRALSYEEIGSAAMLSRATAGAHRGRLLVSMPGSVDAVRLAMTRLVVPELAHICSELDS